MAPEVYAEEAHYGCKVCLRGFLKLNLNSNVNLWCQRCTVRCVSASKTWNIARRG